MASYISNFISTLYYSGRSAYFTENENRKNLLNSLEVCLNDPNQSATAKLYCRELKEKIGSMKKTQDPTDMCKTFKETSARYKSLVSRVESAARGVFEEASFEKLYQEVSGELAAFKQFPMTETERSIHVGRITQAFRGVDNALAKTTGEPSHKFCGCHILEKGAVRKAGLEKFTVSYPSAVVDNPALKGKAALLQSWSLGGGHNVAQRGMAQRLAEVGMHSYHVEADNETLVPFDSLRGLTKGGYCDTDLIRDLMRNNYWKTLRFINWAFSGKPNEQKYQAIMDQFMRSILSRGVPELHMTIFARNAGAAANASGLLGVAATNISTDLPADFFDIETPTDMQNPHFLNAAMVGGDAMLANANTALPGRTVVTGFPVRKAFLEQYDIATLRNQAGIAADARVVILSSGGEGVENGYAEYIVNQYRMDKCSEKIHLVIICGRNTAKKEKLEKDFANLKNSLITVQVKGWTEEKELGEFSAMAADPVKRGALISTKGGGGTLSEGLASGVPMLLGSSDDIIWEKKNIDFVCENSCGLRFKGEPDLMGQLEKLFKMKYQRINIDSKQESIDLVSRQIQAMEEDVVFQSLRVQALEFKVP